MRRVAYYKGCLASLSAKELDSSTQALAPKVGLELIELETVTCCGAGDIHEAEPDYYLHLNARILAYAEATGADTLLTICNVCTLNLRQANWQLKNDEALRERVSANLRRVVQKLVVRLAEVQRADVADRHQRVDALGRGIREDPRIEVQVVVRLRLVDVAGAAARDRLELDELVADLRRERLGRRVELLRRQARETALVVRDLLHGLEA